MDANLDFDGSDHDDRDNIARDENIGPACQTCRKKKAKCSREKPSCSQCIKYGTSCLYDKEKGKPGMRAGAIDRLNERVDRLESMFLGQGVLWQNIWNSIQANNNEQDDCEQAESLSQCTQQLKQTLESLGHKRQNPNPEQINSPKRRRIDREFHSSSMTGIFENDTLPADLLDSLVEIYFSRIHPWIPTLHRRLFCQRLKDPKEQPKLSAILRAIVSATVRFSDDPRLGPPEARSRLARTNKQTVILQSMESFSVENLQALIICAFDTIGSGRGPSAWSIVGSMTRTAEQLQLSIEDEPESSPLSDTRTLVERMHFLPPCKSWTEREERRRVFWNIFLMDRFCSIATGWNVCLTSADVKRRLPCEGQLWEEGKPLHIPTPYFGVSDPPSIVNNRLPNARPEEADQASLGGFAYCIEAAESLSLVTSFFLQQAVDVKKTHDIQLWLMRFKQLDLRLIQWKMSLPERWREACALNEDGNMDPNLTLAHITHNTAVVLLHQGVAYPTAEWQSLPINLPSAPSAKTCLSAAVEVSIIVAEFLRNTRCLTNPQFAFCLFICGRMLIVHSLYYTVPLSPCFDQLIDSLREMSNRWNGDQFLTGDNLASKFAHRLHHARQSGDPSLDIRQAAYAEDQSDGTNQESTDAFGQVITASGQCETPDSITLAFPPLPLAFQAQPTVQTSNLDYLGYNPVERESVDQNIHSFEQNIDLENLASFLDYSVLPDQRVSAFSS